jgi:hypothetical protein
VSEKLFGQKRSFIMDPILKHYFPNFTNICKPNVAYVTSIL